MIYRVQLRLFALILCLLPGLSLAQSTEEVERDRGLLQAFLEDNLSAAGRVIQIDGFAGALSSRATLERLTIADDDGVWLTLEGAVLDWNRSAVLRGRVEINELTAERLILTRLPAGEESTAPVPEAPGFTFALPDLPVSIDIAEFAMDRAELGAPVLGQELVLSLTGAAALADGAGNVTLDVDRLDGPAGKIAVRGSYVNETQALDLSLSFEEDAGGIAASLLDLPDNPSVSLSVDGTGTLADFNADLRLATNGAPRVEGQITLGALPADGDAAPDRRFGADIEGDIAPLLPEEHREFFAGGVTLDVAGVAHGDGRLTLEQLALATGSVVLNGAVTLSADQWPEEIAIAGQIANPQGGKVLLLTPDESTRVDRVDLSLGYDAAESDAWTLEATIAGLERPDLSVTRAVLAGDGTLTRGDGSALGAVSGDLTLDIAGVGLEDAALAQAVGDAVTGALAFSYIEDAPLNLTGLNLTAGGATLTGNAEISGVTAGGSLSIDGDLGLNAPDLSRFAPLAGLDLSGGANLAIAGVIDPLGGSLDLDISGGTRDLGLGIAELDPLITGEGVLRAGLRRDETGSFVEGLLIETPETRLTASADLATGASEGEFSFAIADTSVIEPALTGAASAAGTFRQNGETWTISTNLSAPGDIAGRADATLRLPESGPGTLGGIAELNIGTLAPYSGLAGRPLSGSAEITLAGSGNLDDLAGGITVTGEAQDLSFDVDAADKLLAGRATLNVNAARAATGVVTIREAEFLTDQGRATVSGMLAEGQAIAFDVTLNDTALYVPDLTGPATFKGNLTQGASDYRLDSVLTAPGGASGNVNGVVTLVDGAPGPFTAEASLSAASLAPYAPLAGIDLSGGAAVTLRAAGDIPTQAITLKLVGNTRNLAIGVDQADRLMAGDGTLNIEAAYDGAGTLALDTATLEFPAASLAANGSLSATDSALSYALRLANLGVFTGENIGPATLNGMVTHKDPEVTLSATLSGPGETAADIAARTTLEEGAPGPFTANVTLSSSDLSPFGPLTGLTLGGAANLTAEARGHAGNMAGALDLVAETTSLRLGIAQVDTLLAGRGTLDVAASYDGNGTAVIETAEARYPNITATAGGTYSPDGGALNYDVRLANLALFAPGLNGPATAQGTAQSEGADWRVDTALTGPGGMAAQVSGTVAADASRAALSINGSAPLAAANSFIEPNLVSGVARFDLGLNGPLALTSLSGTVSSQGASFVMPSLPLRLSDLNTTVALSGGRAQVSATAAVASGGRIQVSGPVELSAPYRADLGVTLNNVGLEDPGLYQTTVSGQIGIGGALTGGAAIGGTLTLGPVEVRIPSGFGAASGSIPGLIHEHAPNAVLRTRTRAGLGTAGGNSGGGGGGPAYPLDLRINAPNQIFIRGRGLDAELGGSLRLTGTTANVITGGGFELIRGRLDILGERLTLTEGTVRLQGDFNPYVSLVATTTSGGVAIRIAIEGFADAPDLVITSEPEMPEEEVLAQLIFKRGLGQISALQAVQLAAAVRTLAGGGGEGVVDRLRNSFGLDDLDLTTNDEGNATLQVGKYVSENVYTGVNVDSSGKSEVTLNLQITPNVTARGTASSDGETGLGIFFERDY